MVSILFLCFYSWTEDLRQGWKSNLERNGCELSNPRFTTKPFLFSMKIVLCAVVYLLRKSGWFKLFHTSRRFIVPQTISDISCYSPCKNINKLLDRWSPVEIGKLSSLSNPEDILCESLRRLLSFPFVVVFVLFTQNPSSVLWSDLLSRGQTISGISPTSIMGSGLP